MGGLQPGQLLEGTPYKIVREIGAGGMGVVYDVEHVRLKKPYVAKVIHEQIKNEDGAQKRMEREAQVLAGLSHPNIVQVHDVGTTPDGVAYFIMEKLEGGDLRHTMTKGGVPRTRAIQIVSDVLDALDYVHRRGIVHRDIKPENIFLAEQTNGAAGTVTKVLDFGIVHIFDGDGRVSQARITKTGGFVGTLYYVAPEQMQGKPAGPPNDVYAAALVLFELIAGKGPFDDDPGVGLSRCFTPAPTLAKVAKSPKDLSDVVARALDQDPLRRPTAGALAAELRAVGAALLGAQREGEEDSAYEVDDLLRHMAPAGAVAARRPAAGRALTPGPDLAAEATAAPPTPMMAGAAQRFSRASPFEATMASAEVSAPSPRASMGSVPAYNDPRPTMQGAGPAAPQQLGSSPGALPYTGQQPHYAAQRISSPDGVEQGVHALSAPPPAPGFSLSPTGVGAGADGRPSFAVATPRRPDTSPGLYATVDALPGRTAPHVKRGLWLVAAAALTFSMMLVGGALLYRQRATRVASPAPETTNTTASMPSAAAEAAAAAPITSTSAPGDAPSPSASNLAKPQSEATAGASTPAALKHAPTLSVSPAKPGNAVTPKPRPSANPLKKDDYAQEL